MQATSDNILSEILTKTAEYDPTINAMTMHVLYSKSNFDVCGLEEPVHKFCTGSAAEMRIKTLLSCIGDVDIMYHKLDQIALPPQDQYLPAHRLEDMNSLLSLHRIVSLPDYPGYVRLFNGGFLAWNTHTKCYDDPTPRGNGETLLCYTYIGKW